MCYSPITIINPSKYVSVKYRDRFLLQVPCGKCAQCQQVKSNEWLYRSYYEFMNLQECGGFAYFDTLTYSEENLPYMNSILPELPHVPCFRKDDIQKFFKRLRINLERKYCLEDESLRFLAVSEYGSLKGRPHYHILCFVYSDKIKPYEFSKLVSQSWQLGRTDGIPYKSNYYVLTHNTLQNARLGNVLATSQYITKYLQKDCKLQSIIDKRIKYADYIIHSDNYPYKKRGSVACSKLLEKIARHVNQFHLQSLGFGSLALRDIDLNEVFKSGCVIMPSLKNVVCKIPIPMYYQRKLFYDLVVYNNSKMWIPNELGLQYKTTREHQIFDNLVSRLECLQMLLNSHFDCKELANYILNERGRYLSKLPAIDFRQRVEDITHYVYVTRSDKENIGCGVSTKYLGNVNDGYLPLTNYIPIKQFIADFVYMDESKELQIQTLYDSLNDVNQGEQDVFSRKQELTALYKIINDRN